MSSVNEIQALRDQLAQITLERDLLRNELSLRRSTHDDAISVTAISGEASRRRGRGFSVSFLMSKSQLLGAEAGSSASSASSSSLDGDNSAARSPENAADVASSSGAVDSVVMEHDLGVSTGLNDEEEDETPSEEGVSQRSNEAVRLGKPHRYDNSDDHHKEDVGDADVPGAVHLAAYKSGGGSGNGVGSSLSRRVVVHDDDTRLSDEVEDDDVERDDDDEDEDDDDDDDDDDESESEDESGSEGGSHEARADTSRMSSSLMRFAQPRQVRPPIGRQSISMGSLAGSSTVTADAGVSRDIRGGGSGGGGGGGLSNGDLLQSFRSATQSSGTTMLSATQLSRARYQSQDTNGSHGGSSTGGFISEDESDDEDNNNDHNDDDDDDDDVLNESDSMNAAAFNRHLSYTRELDHDHDDDHGDADLRPAPSLSSFLNRGAALSRNGRRQTLEDSSSDNYYSRFFVPPPSPPPPPPISLSENTSKQISQSHHHHQQQQHLSAQIVEPHTTQQQQRVSAALPSTVKAIAPVTPLPPPGTKQTKQTARDVSFRRARELAEADADVLNDVWIQPVMTNSISAQPPPPPPPPSSLHHHQQVPIRNVLSTLKSVRPLSNSIRATKFSVSSSSPSILSPSMVDDLPPMDDDDESSSDEEIMAPLNHASNNKRPSSARLRRPGAAPSSRAASIALGNSRPINLSASIQPPPLPEKIHSTSVGAINGTAHLAAASASDNMVLGPRAGSAGVLLETGGLNEDGNGGPVNKHLNRRPVWSASFAVRRTTSNDESTTRQMGYKGIDGLGPISPTRTSDEASLSSSGGGVMKTRRRPSSSGYQRTLN